tara:strand:+ start:66 stop:662 length:597 start_codon:yes stop_codon:yes gene_type:complete
MFRGIVNNPNLAGIIAPVVPGKEYGLENSPEWDYFKQQVDDYRAGRSAYRSQRTTKGSPTFNLSDEEYKKSSDQYYSGLLNQINANRPAGIGEFALSTRTGRDDPSLINYNPSRTKAYTFGRDGKMAEIGSDRISDYPDLRYEPNIKNTLSGTGAVGKLVGNVLGDQMDAQLAAKQAEMMKDPGIKGALLRSGLFRLA